MTKKRIITFLIILTLIALFFCGGYWYFGHWHWTGFFRYTTTDPQTGTTELRPDKTLWDWLELVIVPLAIAGGLYVLNKNERDREVRRKKEREAEAADQIKENEWQNYLDRMTNLLEKGLRETDLNSPLRDIARVRTLTTLRRLDGSRKGMLLRFLFDAGLIISIPHSSIPHPIVDLRQGKADFTKADLHGAVLTAMVYQKEDKPKGNYSRGISQEAAKLMGLDLSQALEIEVDLSNVPSRTSMLGVVLINANLSNAVLSEALLFGVNLSNSTLVNTDLRKTLLTGANLSGARLSQAKLNGAILYGADLSEADLRGADLSGAKYDDATKWPEGFDPIQAKAIKKAE